MVTLLRKFVETYRRIKNRKFGWFGSYASWEQARADCTGYDADNILQKVKAATLKVKNGEAVYERDAVLYDKISYSWPVVAHLLWIAQQNQNQLSVLDFGGSLGSSYFQNRYYLSHIEHLHWDVVEQEHFVSAGRKEIASGPLSFYHTMEEAIGASGLHHLFFISSVLPYLEKPYELMREVMRKDFPYLMVDLTYFNLVPGDRLTIQKVPPFYYEASYPAWFLDYSKLIRLLEEKYEMIAEFTDEEFLFLDGKRLNYRGFIMKKRN